MQLADAFADKGMKVGFYSLEVGANTHIMVRNRELYIKPHNLPRIFITEEGNLADIRESAKLYDVVVIDSWTKLEVNSIEFDRLRRDFPNTIFIVIFQRTAGNKIRGGTRPLFDAGINIDVVKVDDTFVNNYAITKKNRYGKAGLKFNITKRKII